MEWLDFIVRWIRKLIHFLWFDHHGYVAHFILGIVVGGFVSVFFFRISDNKVRSLIVAFTFVALMGLSKEIIDPYIGRQRDLNDFIFTCCGGFLGCLSIMSNKLLQLMYPYHFKNQ